MTFETTAVITSLGHFHPETVIPNSFFDELDIGSDAQWVEDRTGIKSRRSVLSRDDLLALRHQATTPEKLAKEGKIMSIAEMGNRAWQMLESRNKSANVGLDTVICGTSVPDYFIPANACTIASAINASCFSFDANSACSSFVVNLHLARSMIKSGASKKVAVFNPERYSTRLNYQDKASCVLFGDGCGATLVEANAREGFEILDTIVTSDPEKFDLVQIPEDGHFFQNGKAVQKFAISRTIEITLDVLNRNNLTLNDISYLIGHQANLRMLVSAISKLGLQPEQHLYNVDTFGNQGGAGAPAVLSMNWDRFRSGDLVVVSVVGSGLTWASALLRKI